MKVVIELKTLDAAGLGGQLLTKMGFRSNGERNCFTKIVTQEADDEVYDDKEACRPYIERLLDDGITPRRVQTEVRPAGLVTVGSTKEHHVTAALDNALRALASAQRAVSAGAPHRRRVKAAFEAGDIGDALQILEQAEGLIRKAQATALDQAEYIRGNKTPLIQAANKAAIDALTALKKMHDALDRL